MSQFIALFNTAIIFGTVILLGAIGEILTEKSGNLNLGVPGIMSIGGIAGLIGTFLYENSCSASGIEPNKFLCLIIALVCSIVASVLAGLIYSVLTITLRANQNVTGLTLTIFGGGFANFYGGTLNKIAGGVGQVRVSATASVFGANLNDKLQAGAFGELFLSYGFMVYFAVIVAILLTWIFKKTSVGLNIRAVGENPGTADAAGINVTKYKYLSTCIGAAISGLGGLFFVMDYTSGTWSNDGGLESLGWLAVALVIFARWKPVHAIWGSYLFGLLSRAYFYIGGLNRSSQEIFKMLPYVVTILIIVIVSVKKNKDNLGPAGLGQSYFREDR